MNPAHATLAGVALTASRPVSWALQTGFDPVQRIFECHRTAADSLEKNVGKAVTLSITTSDGSKAEFKGLYIVGQMPSTHPHLRAYLVADRRWLWKRKWVYRYFNVPRRTGDTFFLEGEPRAIAPLDDTFTFKDWSVHANKKRWTATEALEEVLKAVDGQTPTFDDKPTAEVSIQGNETDDDGSTAVARVMAKCPGFGCFVGMDGKVHVLNMRKVAAADAMLAKKFSVLGSPEVATARLQGVRPKSITVLFTREVEIRFDSVTESDDVPTIGANSPFMENVLPVPDASLDVTINGQSTTVAQGTWITLAQAITAWNRDTPSGITPLSFEVIRKTWLRGNHLEARYASIGRLTPDANWVARIATLREHYRQTYRISQRWMRRIKGLRNYRVAVFDVISGVRSPTSVYMDYCAKPSRKGYFKGPEEQWAWLNVHGYPGDGGNPDTDGSKAPALVSILDQDIGIIHVDFHADPSGRWADTIPALVVDESGAEHPVNLNMSDWRRKPIAANAKVFGTNTGVELARAHRVCCILTAIPAAPNDETQFHAITLSPADFTGKLADIGTSGQGDGPAWTTRVNAQIVTARCAWKQSEAGSLYEGLFGLPSVQAPKSVQVDKILVNRDALREVAQAKAASLWSMLMDRHDGQKITHFDGDAKSVPTGNIDLVAFTLATNGACFTEFTATPMVNGIDPFAMLPDSIRTAVLGLVPA